MKRRTFIQSIGGMFLAGNISFSKEEKNKDSNSVIFVFLSGGASHIETFTPIPGATAERRSVTGFVNTNVPGIEIGGLFKELGNKADKFAIVRGFTHRDANHSSATHWVMTGEANLGQGTTQIWPSYGSVISGVDGPSVKSGLPTYVKMAGIEHDDAAWMGGKYVGYDATQEGRKDLKLGMGEDRFKYRLKLLEFIDKDFGNNSLITKQWKDLREQAVDVVVGEASKAFEVEKDAEYDNYKGDRLGLDFLTSMRLVEKGCKFVTVNYGGWDMHNNINAGLNQRQPTLDHYLAMLIDSLEKRGLQNVMLVVTTEFGRTPKINSDGGRDHHSQLIPLLISSPQHEMGRIIGSCDKNAEMADERYTPDDLRYTILDHLGVNKNAKWTSIDGRPMQFIKDEAKLIL